MTLKIEKAYIKVANSELQLRFVITEDGIPLDEVNAWLDSMSENSPLTGERYGYVLKGFLEYLKLLSMHYRDVTKQATLKSYIKHLLGYSGEKIVNTDGVKNVDVVMYNVSVITQFYLWLETNGKIDEYPTGNAIQPNRKGQFYVKKKFMYGQIYKFDNSKKNEFYHRLRFADRQEHTKWYTIEEIQKFIDNMPSHKDRLIFRISVECGLRISEILGLHLEHVNRFEELLEVRRNNNIENLAYAKTWERNVPILDDYPIFADNLMTDIENYINGEREQSDIYRSSYLFINNKGKYKGMPVKRRNFLKILKRVGAKIGFDPTKIRTHSGRSTRAETLVRKCYEQGDSIEIVSDYIGNSVETLRKYYRNQASTGTQKHTMKRIAPRQIKQREDEKNADNN
ncbi:site-specific integrase [Paenibacillus sp. DMB5]|uniref:tyrosine-type recombinase/integrase n=1 Tax=Paenibacillus sp. DMB5 TaxID=1780103 RepID=UPI00076C8A8D|nr:site-specific integrase [Paenibacillus sp. DMB5]KUP25793.1 hypothetical protein AWJ19_19405 [Paenibacillus sp. DMB5]